MRQEYRIRAGIGEVRELSPFEGHNFLVFFFFQFPGKTFRTPRKKRDAGLSSILFSSKRELCSVGDDIPGVDNKWIIEDGMGEESLISLFYRAAGREGKISCKIILIS